MEGEDGWRDTGDGETIKTETVSINNNGLYSKKTVTTKRTVRNGVANTITTEEYEFPDGSR